MAVVVADGAAQQKGTRIAEFLGSCDKDYGGRQEGFPISKFLCQQTENKTNLDSSLFYLDSSAKLPQSQITGKYDFRVLRHTSCQKIISPVPWGPPDLNTLLLIRTDESRPQNRAYYYLLCSYLS